MIWCNGSYRENTLTLSERSTAIRIQMVGSLINQLSNDRGAFVRNSNTGITLTWWFAYSDIGELDYRCLNAPGPTYHFTSQQANQLINNTIAAVIVPLL